jgi:hypothetical protein
MPRNATIFCKILVGVGVLKRENFEKAKKKINDEEMNQKINMLKALPQFSQWTRSTLLKFALLLQTHKYFRSQYVYKEGENA